MSEPRWLDRDDILGLHRDQIEEFGGAHGVLHEDATDACLARPLSLFLYEQVDDLFRLAACYAYGFARRHAFRDGNKRIALMSAGAFLYDHGYHLLSRPATGPQLFEELAQGLVTEEELAAILNANCAPLP